MIAAFLVAISGAVATAFVGVSGIGALTMIGPLLGATAVGVIGAASWAEASSLKATARDVKAIQDRVIEQEDLDQSIRGEITKHFSAESSKIQKSIKVMNIDADLVKKDLEERASKTFVDKVIDERKSSRVRAEVQMITTTV